jgi:hypothetical protein
MGIHSGPVSGVVDVNERANLAGAGINMAKRGMDCGDAGHILLSKHIAEDLAEFEEWRPLLHDLGTCEVKHGMQIDIVNLGSDDVGEPSAPTTVQTQNADAIPVLGRLRRSAGDSRLFAAIQKGDLKRWTAPANPFWALKPVTFHYKSDNTNTPQFGLIAEEVASVNPDLAVRDKEGNIYTVCYDAVNAMLLNEFLKEHRQVQEQGAIIAKQQKQIEALTAGLQKVTAQLEANQPTPLVVANNH